MKSNLGLILGLAGCIGIPVLLTLGNAAIDQPEPDKSTALLFYGITMFCVLAIIALFWILPTPPRPAYASWLLLGLVFGFLFANIMEGYPYTLTQTTIWIGVGCGIAVLTTWLSSEDGDPPARVIAMTFVFALFLAAAYHVMTIDRQVEMAREAYEDTPGLGALLALLGLGAAYKLRA